MKLPPLPLLSEQVVLLSDQVVVFERAVVAALLSGLHLYIENKI